MSRPALRMVPVKKNLFNIPAALLLALLLLPTGCAGPEIIDPEVSAETHRLNAAMLIDNGQYAEAEQETTQAILKAPGDAALYLMQGELLEVRGRPAEAARAYRKGLEADAASPQPRNALTHRLALLELLELDRPDEARSLRDSLPASSLERIDLTGTIALAGERPVAALKSFASAPNTTSRPEMAAWIRFHAARAYHLLGDEENTRAALYVAVNNVRSPVLKREIEDFWEKINSSQ